MKFNSIRLFIIIKNYFIQFIEILLFSKKLILHYLYKVFNTQIKDI